MATLMRKINVIARAEAVYRSDLLPGEDLRAVHHTYILAICGHPGFSQEELAQYIGTDKSNVARQLAHLEKHGYVERTPSVQDKRRLLIYPTARMKEALPKVRAIASDWNSFLSEDLSPEEEAFFHQLLDRLMDRCSRFMEKRNEVSK